MYKKHLYNDANYLVLAKIIEEVTKKPFVQNYYERLGQPLSLENSAFYNESPFKKYMAKGYYLENGQLELMKTDTLQQYYGAGNLYMTTTDMGRLLLSLEKDKIFNSSITNPLLHEFGTTRYPSYYRYGFYAYPKYNRVSGMFNGQNFTGFTNGNYTVIIAANKVSRKTTNNEYKIDHIYHNILNQNEVINFKGITVD